MTAFTPESADRHLAQYRRGKADPTPEEAENIRAALISLVNQADFITLGVCAESAAAAIQGLNGYLLGLDQDFELDAAGMDALEGCVYVKFNTRSQKLYGDHYSGNERGILVATQADYDHKICGVYGHFPLDLFS